MILFLGNSGAIEPQVGTSVASPAGEDTTADPPKPIEGDQVTKVELPEMPFDELFQTLGAIWRLHSSKPAPDWVEGNDEEIVSFVSRSWSCPIGRPDDHPTLQVAEPTKAPVKEDKK